MGFDNECVLNIQSLAGEYFCPVCRLLVYPNEALQSQCTHLYCKPCLTYIISTTQACPYDGYLVTEADSKPLVESNKGLAETIGKITVHCLFHRSGCTWQGPLSECTSHCSGCAFGNSPVVCNRCGIQIVHRQVQEHAQNCPGVQQPQSQQVEGAQDAAATGTPAKGDQTQTTAQAGATTSQVQTQTTPPTGKESSQPANSNSQPQAVAQVAVPTAEQWYQQQQQYQQYYQQYPGYNPYQQHYQQYYPYQQQAVPQYQQQHSQVQPQGYTQSQAQPQPQSQPQLQPQPQIQPQGQTQPQLQLSQPPVRAPVAAQPQNQSQVNPHQQTHPPPNSHPVPQPQSYPQAHAQSYPQAQAQLYPQAQTHPQPQPVQPHSQHMQMPQYQQPLSQLQHTQPQIQYPVPQPQPQPQSHSQTQQQTQVQHQPQLPSQNHPQLHPPVHNQTQTQNTASHAVTGYHSYPQPQPHQQMPFSGPLQHPIHVHPHGGAHLQVQNQFPQQNPQLRPPQSHATILNQQQPTLLPSPIQPPNISGAQQPPVHPHAQPGVPVHQRAAMQPVQHPMAQQYVQQQQPFAGQPQQGPFAQQQPPSQSQLRPQNPLHSFQQHSHAYSQPQQNIALVLGMQSHQPQNLVGQPMTPNHGIQSQPYQQSATGLQGRSVQFGLNQPLSNQSNIHGTNNQMQLSSEQQSEAASKPSMSEKQNIIEKIVDEKEADPSSQKTAKNDATSGPQNTDELKIPKSETDVKLIEEGIQAEVEGKTNPVDTSAKDFVAEPVSDAAENAEPVIKQMVKEEVIKNVEDRKDSINVDRKPVGNSLLEDKDIQDGPPVKTSSLQGAAQLGEQTGKLQTGKNLPQAQGVPPGPGFVPLAGQVRPGGFVQSPPIQQRPAAPPMFQALPPGPAHHIQAPGNRPTQFRPQESGHLLHPGQPLIPPGSASAASFARGPSHYGSSQRSFEPTIAPQGPYNQGHLPPIHVGAPRISQGDPVGGLTMHILPPSAFDSHGGMMAGPPYVAEGQMGKQHTINPMEAEIFPGQRPGYLEVRQPDSHLPGSVERSPLGQPSGVQSNLMRMNGAPGPQLQDERFKPFPDERLNPFQMDPTHRVIDHGEFEEDLKQFPRPSHLDTEPVSKLGSRFPSSRPLDRGSLGFGMDVGLRPYDKGLNYDPGLKLDPMAGSAPSRYLPSYAGERPGLHEDLSVRSDSGRTHPDFLGPGHGYGRRRLMGGSSPRSPVREYPGISSHGFGGLPGNPGSSRLGLDDIDGREFRRSDGPIGNSFHESRFPVFPSHLHRGEFEGPARSGDLIGQDFLPSHLRRGDTVRFGGFPGHGRMGDLGGPGTFPHPRLGEPGFRSSFSHQGFPNDGGIYAGDMEPFENSRKRKPPSMGWCRICKVDCETVEGLDLHSQTREHQKMALDMVVSIKQNAKKQKLTSGDRATRDDANKSRNASSEGRGKKH